MLTKIWAISILAAFYFFYIAKMLIQAGQSIKTNQAGKGNKPLKVRIIERIMSLAAILTIIAEIISIFAITPVFPKPVVLLGAVTGIVAVVLFATAVITMKKSWRVGIPEEKTAIVTNGIYRISRNPAFLGFDLLYLSMALMFFNIPLLLCPVWAAVMLHLQILQEEKWLDQMFGEEYRNYSRKVMRYLGRRRQ